MAICRIRLACVVSAALSPLLPAQATPVPAGPDPALLQVAASYAAKVAASAVFVSGRTIESVLAEELAADGRIEAMIRPLLRFDVDAAERTVTCRILTASATAVATAGLGCTLLLPGSDVATLRTRRVEVPFDLRADTAFVEWPAGELGPDAPPAAVDRDALAQALEAAFAEPATGPAVRTRAVVVVDGGQLVAERYAEGCTADMPLPGWSMSKTLVSVLCGIRAHQGELDLDAPPAVDAWRTADDARAGLRLPHLLTMTAGLAWNESYTDPTSDALRMLFGGTADHAAVYAAQPLAEAPGTQFRYSSGATNLLCRLLRGTFADDAEYWAFPRTQLFAPLGMASAVLETDPSGTFVGSSYGFATARDWARFGLFLADDGRTPDGQRLLPEGWLQRSFTPAPASRGRYGWQIWLNVDPDGDGPQQRAWPELPAELVHLDGHEGQYCVVVPSRRFVLVRLGCTKQGGFDVRALVRDALLACRSD